MEKVCLQCGDKGYTNAFVHCVKCLEYVVHRYCLDVIPETLDEFVRWLCDDCELEEQNLSVVSGLDTIPCQTSDNNTVLENIKEISRSETKKDNVVHVYESGPNQLNDDCREELRLAENSEPANEGSIMELQGMNNNHDIEQSSSLSLVEDKTEDNLTLSARLSIVKENMRKNRSSLVKSLTDKDQGKCHDGSEPPILSCNGRSKKKRIVMSFEANTEEKRHRREEHKEENQCADLCTEGRDIEPSNVHKEEEKAMDNLIQQAELSSVKENLKKWTKSVDDKDQCRSSNESLRNSKERSVMSSEANVDKQRLRVGFARTCEESKELNLENQCANANNEERIIGTSNGHNEKAVDNLIHHPKSSNAKENMKKKRDDVAKPALEKDCCLSGNGSDARNASEDNPILSSLKSSKKNKRIVKLSDANGKEKRHKVDSAQTCQENKEVIFEKFPDGSTEKRGKIPSNEHKEEKKASDNVIQHAELSSIEENVSKRSVVAKSSNKSDSQHDIVKQSILSCNESMKISNKKRTAASSEANRKEKRHKAGSAQTCEENKDPGLEMSADGRTEKRGKIPSNEHKEEEKDSDNVIQHAELPNAKEKVKKRSKIAKSSTVKDRHSNGNGLDTRHDIAEHRNLSCNGSVICSNKNRIASSSEANGKEKRHRAGSSHTTSEKNKEVELGNCADGSTEKRARGSINDHEEEEKASSSNLKVNIKKISVAAKSSTEANGKEKMHSADSVQIGKENKEVDLENPSIERRGVGSSIDHIKNRAPEVTEEKPSPPQHNSNPCLDSPKDSSTEPLPATCIFGGPIVTAIWKGTFNIRNRKHEVLDGLRAHVSSVAIPRVYEAALQLQTVLHLEILPKSNVWPKSFQTSELNGAHIGLYFFSNLKRSEGPYDRLVKDMINEDLAMRASVENAELSIFTSMELPTMYWRFEGKPYLWGVFKGKPNAPPNSRSCKEESGDDKVVRANLPPSTLKNCDLRSPLSPLSNNGSCSSGAI